jgi:hypothetical protein
MNTSVRFTKKALLSSERPRTLYDYYVTGRGYFPFDMLRYDACWPASGEDAARIEWEFAKPGDKVRRDQRSVRLRSYREPTVDRWTSFGWSVGVHDFTEKLEAPNVVAEAVADAMDRTR